MVIKSFNEWQDGMSSICPKCGQEFWGHSETCDDCKDSDLEEVPEKPVTVAARDQGARRDLPRFGVPTTRSQNIYYL